MAIDCMIDYVFPFYGCNSPSGTPLSNLYLSNLPGIQFKTLDQIANEDQVSWAGVWNDIQTRASINFQDDINEEFQKRYLLKQIVQSVDLGFNNNNSILTPNDGSASRGFSIETTDQSGVVACSNLQLLYMQSVSFYFYDAVGTGDTLTITIKDADLNTTLYTTTITQASGLVQGWNTIQLEKQFTARRAFVFFSGTFTNYVNLDISQFVLNNFGPNWSSSWNSNSLYIAGWGGGSGCQARINGVSLATGATNNLAIFGYNTFGGSMQFGLHCSFNSIVCNNRKYFASAWQLCLAKEFIDELTYSSRLNRWTTIDKSKYEELGNLFELQYRGGTSYDKGAAKEGLKVTKAYPGKLSQAITGIILNTWDCCLQANDHLMHLQAIM